eukprot:scaffold240745_cov22-Tisochrysis_lutea.AAC.1
MFALVVISYIGKATIGQDAWILFFIATSDAHGSWCTKNRQDFANQTQVRAVRRGSLTSKLAQASPMRLTDHGVVVCPTVIPRSVSLSHGDYRSHGVVVIP